MLFHRGIKGKLKLNPAIKFLGGLLLSLLLAVGGLAYRFLDFRDTTTNCVERGGTWIGGALRASYCALDMKEDSDW